MHLIRLVNYGHSYNDAEELFNLLASFPLQQSTFHLFKPRRNILKWPKADKQRSKLKQLHLLQYCPEVGTVKGYFHSGISNPIHFKFHPTDGLRKEESEINNDSSKTACSLCSSATSSAIGSDGNGNYDYCLIFKSMCLII